MKITKGTTETYILANLDELDVITVYVTNYRRGQGKIVIECFGDAWAYYWGAMGERTLQQFFLNANNGYILGKLLSNIRQTDFDKINDTARKRGSLLCVTNDVEVAIAEDEMAKLFGPDWYMELPTCCTREYEYLDRILDVIKAAFRNELQPVYQ